jgi:hypothetical protein
MAADALADDEILGAFVRRGGAGDGTDAASAGRLLLIEPNREARLAATLARFGEGIVAVWLWAGDGGLDAVASFWRARDIATTTVTLGPLGPEIGLAAGPAWGPHLLVVGPDASSPQPRTIAP